MKHFSMRTAVTVPRRVALMSALAGVGVALGTTVVAPPVQAAVTVWKGEKKITDSSTDTLTPPTDAAQRFAAAGGIRLGEQLSPGEYFLQVVARTPDPDRRGKQRSATQRVEFEVR